jgi:hypothetical protein
MICGSVFFLGIAEHETYVFPKRKHGHLLDNPIPYRVLVVPGVEPDVEHMRIAKTRQDRWED